MSRIMHGSRSLAVLWLWGVCVMAAAPVQAHHSFAAYDLSKSITVKGTIKSFAWTMPHSQLTLLVANEHGGADEWVIEAGAPNLFVKQGWKRSDLKDGEEVTVVLHPRHDASSGGSMVQLTTSEGRVLAAAGPPPSGAPPTDSGQ